MNKTCYWLGHKKVLTEYGNYKCLRCKEHHSSEIYFTDSFLSSTWFIALTILTCAIFIVGLVFFLSLWSDKMTCISYAKYNIEVSWSFWNGCMAKHSQYGWLPISKYFEIMNLFVH